MKPWTLAISDSRLLSDSTSALLLGWDSTVAGARQTHVFQIDIGTSFTPQFQEEFLARLLCHLVVDRIPSVALSELTDTLGRAYEFYTTLPGSSVRRLGTPQDIAANFEGRLPHRIPVIENEE